MNFEQQQHQCDNCIMYETLANYSEGNCFERDSIWERGFENVRVFVYNSIIYSLTSLSSGIVCIHNNFQRPGGQDISSFFQISVSASLMLVWCLLAPKQLSLLFILTSIKMRMCEKGTQQLKSDFGVGNLLYNCMS